MLIEEALVAYLISYNGLSALVASRVYPLTVPQSSILPALAYQTISTDRLHAFQQDTGLASKMIQISSWAESLKDAKSVAAQVRAALQNYSGVMGGTGGVKIDAVLIENELDDYNEQSDSYAVIQEYEIWYQEV
jgi:predicted PurR-regulated permease PerM